MTKKRPSKAARASNISIVSLDLGEGTHEETEDNEATASSSVGISSLPKAATGSKKGRTKKSAAGSKPRVGGPKQDESRLVSSFVEPEDDNFEVKVPQPVVGPRGKKRDSSEMSDDDVQHAKTLLPSDDQITPPRRKRRGTRVEKKPAEGELHLHEELQDLKNDNEQTHMDASDIPVKVKSGSKKQTKGRTRKASASKRKVSTASAASKASLRADLPDNEELEAALAEDLERPLTDDGSGHDSDMPETPADQRGQKVTTKNAKKATTSVAPTRRTTRASTIVVDDSAVGMHTALSVAPMIERNNEPESQQSSQLNPPKQRKGTTRKASAKATVEAGPSAVASVPDLQNELPVARSKASNGRGISRQKAKQQAQDSVSRSMNVSEPNYLEREGSLHTLQATVLVPADHTELAGRPKMASARRSQEATSSRATSEPGVGNTHNPESQSTYDATDVNSVTTKERTEFQYPSTSGDDQRTNISSLMKRGLRSRGLLAAIEGSKKQEAEASEPIIENTEATDLDEIPVYAPPGFFPEPDQALPSSPPQASGHSTPINVASPASTRQSSDAENQPPSSRPSQNRPPLGILSPSVHNETPSSRTPLAIITPKVSPSKRAVTTAGISKLSSAFPWTAVDIEGVFQDSPGAVTDGRETAMGVFAIAGGMAAGAALTSPERKLTVEEWIKWKAERAEERLREQCERLVGTFEVEGVRALRVLEGVECID